jgi:hypothetical protein
MLREQARKERAMAAKATDRPAGDLALRQQPLFDPPVKVRTLPLFSLLAVQF